MEAQHVMQEALRQSEERFRLLVESVRDYAIFMLDPQGYITSWNEGAQRAKGYRSAEIIGQHFSRFYTPEDRTHGKPDSILKTAHETGRVHDEGWRVRKDGSRFWADVTITAVRNSQGELQGFAKVTRDITERRENELKIEQKQREINALQKMEAIGRLSAGIAHDFNNLVAGILGCAESIEMSVGSRSLIGEDLNEIKKACDRSKVLVRQLIAFSRRQMAVPKPTQVNTVLKDMTPLIRHSIPSNIKLEMNLSPDIPDILADVGQLEQILINVVLNARDAMPKGGRLKIQTRLAMIDEYSGVEGFPVRPAPAVIITVSDTGVGITPQIKEMMFEPFFTTKPVGKGSGLGLSTVYGIVQQNQGGLAVYSEPGIGTTFNILMPLSNPQRISDVPQRDSKDELRAQNKELVLVVEDEPLVLRNTVRALQDRGYEVMGAGTAEEGMRLFEEAKDRIKLLLTDVIMPGISGKDLAILIQKQDPNMPVLYMSGYAADIIADHGLITYDVNFIEKPFSAHSLAQKIHDILNTNPH
jgi:PAS domain S-box-containing protein